MPGHYAQAQATTPTDPVGQIEKVVGIADVVRNGVSVTLHVGDKVFQSDIIQTGADSSCGVSFPDGTALNLVANTRMVLNEYSFNANSTSNTALFSLVEGTFAAVAGAVAHTGNMKVGTPVATMGIRGTTFVLGTILGEVFFLLREDYHTDHHKGVLAIENFGITIADTDYLTYCTTTSCRSEPLTNSQNALFRNIIDGLDDVIDRSTTNPKNLDHIPGSGDNPNLLLPLPQFLQENVTPPIFINVGFNPSNSNPPPNNFDVINFSPLFTPTLTPPSGPASTIFIWNSTGAFPWPTNGDWNNGQPPGQPTDQVVVQSGTLNYNLPGTTSLLSLTVDAGATLLITSGELMTVNLFDYGTIIVQGDPPILLVNGPAVIGPSGQFIVTGSGDEAEFTGSTLDNQGLIAAAQGGEVLILNELVTNEAGAKIVSGGDGSFVNFKGTSLALFDAVDNFGKLIAAYGGSIAFEFSEVMNEASGELTSIGHGSVIGLSDANFFNLGDVVAKDGGEIAFLDAYADNENNGLMEAKAFSTLSFVNTDVVNETGALIEADGRDAEIKFDRGYVSNTGRIEAEDGGEVSFYKSHVDNDRSGVIEADGRGSEIEFGRDHVNNSGRIEAEYGGKVSFYESHVDNDGSGVIEADGYGSEIKFDRDSINNDGTIGARFGGLVDVNDSTIMQGRDGIIEAVGYNSTVNLDNATIIGGTLLIGDHGRVDIEGGRNGGATLDDVRVDNDGTIRVDDPAQATKLTLEDGTIVHGGMLSIGDHGTVDIEGGRNGGATLDDVTVWNRGDIKVDEETGPQTTLHLTDGTTVNGGTLTIGRYGEVDIQAGDHANGATLNNVDVWNDGIITFGGGDAGGSGDPDLFIGGTVALRGAGQLILSGSNDNIVGTREGGELDNYSNIVGTGHIGNGDRSLTFDNEAHGLVDATGLLVIDTGCQTIDNDGSLKASGGGELLVKSGVDNFWGSIAADAGSTVDLEGLVRGGDAMIAGGTLIFAAAWGVETSFANDTPHNTSTLVLEGTGLSFVTDAIAGFSHGDIIDLADITFNSCGPSKTSFSLFGDYLTVSDGLHGPSMTIQLDGIYNASDIVLSKDTNGDTQVEFDSPPVITGTQTTSDSSSATILPHGSDKVSGEVGGTVSFDDPDAADTHTASVSPDGDHYVGTFSLGAVNESEGVGSVPWSFNFSNVQLSSGQTLTQSYDVKIADEHGATATQELSVSIGGPGNDNFVFKPGVGADTIVNFNPQADTIELDHFANIQHLHDLASMITTDGHGGALIALGNHDSIDIPAVTASYLQAHLQSLVHLH